MYVKLRDSVAAKPSDANGRRSEALTKAFLLTPRDTDVSWSLRIPQQVARRRPF